LQKRGEEGGKRAFWFCKRRSFNIQDNGGKEFTNMGGATGEGLDKWGYNERVQRMGIIITIRYIGERGQAKNSGAIRVELEFPKIGEQ